MTTKQLIWLNTNVETKEEYYREVPLKGLTNHLIDNDIEFLKELLQNWED